MKFQIKYKKSDEYAAISAALFNTFYKVAFYVLSKVSVELWRNFKG